MSDVAQNEMENSDDTVNIVIQCDAYVAKKGDKPVASHAVWKKDG